VRRNQAIDFWRAGHEVGVSTANRRAAEDLDRSADYLAARRIGTAQAALDAVLLELVGVLAEMFCPACGDELPVDSGRCDACTARSRRRGAGAAGWPINRMETAA
jgi:hypothetical protein